jgi:UDP-N-acetylglucosamine acyltransferase
MSISPAARIHPTAVISADAEVSENVQIGPFVVVEGRVRIGPDCVIRPHAVLCGPLSLGRGNIVFPGAILGEAPQHLKYNNEATATEIGDFNSFREHVTVHRGTSHSWVTRIGHHNYFMANSHVGHDCRIGNHCIITNGALIGGHAVIADNVYLSGNSAVHQFVRIGRLAMLSGCSASTKDVPPFVITQGIDATAGVNLVGMRRAGLTHEQINAVRQAFRIIFRDGLILPTAIARLEQELGGIDVIQEMIDFLKTCPKGINPIRSRHAEAA